MNAISIRIRLIILLLLCIVAPIVLLSSISYLNTKDQLRAMIQNQLKTDVSAIVGKLENSLRDTIADIDAWTTLTVFQDVMVDDNEGDIDTILTLLRKKYSHISELAVLNTSGAVVAATTDDNKEKEFANALWFKEAIIGRSYRSTTVQLHPLANERGLLIARPIPADYDSDTIIGVLVGIIRWKNIQQNLSTLSVAGRPQEQHALLLLYEQPSGTILYVTGNEPQAFAMITKQISAAAAGAGLIDLQNRQYLSAIQASIDTGTDTDHKDFKKSHWVIVELLDTDIAYESVHQMRKNTIIIGSLMLIVAIGAGWMVAGSITMPITEIVSRLRVIADGRGDLTVSLNIVGRDELTELAGAFNLFVNKLRDIVREIIDDTNQLTDIVQRTSVLSLEASKGLTEQHGNSEHLIASVDEMANMITEISMNADQASIAAEQANDEAQESKQVVAGAINTITVLAEAIEQAAIEMKQLNEESKSIDMVLNVIQNVAEQTNLLALNASIEAARAGEHGRGFAVVAEEVRTLATRTSHSAMEIRTVIGRLQKQTLNVLNIMEHEQQQAKFSVIQAEKVGTSLDAIAASIVVIKDMNREIASSTAVENAAFVCVNRNLDDIGNEADKTVERANDITANSEHLEQLTARLKSLINQFKV